MTAGPDSAGTPGSSGPGGRPLAEELRLLLDAVAERAQPWLQSLTAQTTGATHDSATCGWCPLCAGLALLRGERSDLTARAAEHLSGLLSVLRAAVTEPTAAATAGPAAAAGPADSDDEPSDEPSDDEPQVQRIPVRRATGTSPC